MKDDSIIIYRIRDSFELSLPDIFLTATRDIPELLRELSRHRG
ncbi:MAG TPA: hypothetical protein VJL57_01895 [Candidatus Paceibacterota bacterium]